MLKIERIEAHNFLESAYNDITDLHEGTLRKNGFATVPEFTGSGDAALDAEELFMILKREQPQCDLNRMDFSEYAKFAIAFREFQDSAQEGLVDLEALSDMEWWKSYLDKLQDNLTIFLPVEREQFITLQSQQVFNLYADDATLDFTQFLALKEAMIRYDGYQDGNLPCVVDVFSVYRRLRWFRLFFAQMEYRHEDILDIYRCRKLVPEYLEPEPIHAPTFATAQNTRPESDTRESEVEWQGGSKWLKSLSKLNSITSDGYHDLSDFERKVQKQSWKKKKKKIFLSDQPEKHTNVDKTMEYDWVSHHELYTTGLAFNRMSRKCHKHLLETGEVQDDEVKGLDFYEEHSLLLTEAKTLGDMIDRHEPDHEAHFRQGDTLFSSNSASSATSTDDTSIR